MYGTLGTITNIHTMDEEFLYEINYSEILYFEHSLQFLSEYDGTVFESETVEVELMFGIGDLVYVKGYGDEIFKIVGYRTELWRYKDDAWEEVIYELVRVRDGEWMESSADELKLAVSKKEADQHLQNIHIIRHIAGMDAQKNASAPMNSQKNEKKTKPMQQEIIDSLLDLYNDYKGLYDLFGDKKYKEMMDVVIQYLKKMSRLP
ncbi:hypothetical protein [Aeribacillus pallidus]|uniref:hypothetical protein n=1 Tax=Aeribacillus pallidus TaxID=33936 RepID=UPI001E497B09|nr:hypothetical protein [Aeribacillus pallidus]